MPRLRVIVLDQPAEDVNSYRYALWADVPAARQSFYASSATKSAWSGATTADTTNLQSGSVVESVSTMRIPSGTTVNQIEAFLQSRWQDYQNHISDYNPWVHYGTTWDGTTWTLVTGA